MFRLSGYFLVRFIIGAYLSLPVSATVVRFDVEFGGQPAGAIYVDLFDAGAPINVANFLNYTDDGAGNRRYDNTFIHRKISGFVIQGGGFAYDPALGDFSETSSPRIQVDPPIQNEFDPSRSNVRGTIAMAKLGSDPDSATSQWFINLADNSANLDTQNGGFTVFGRVLGNGMALVDAIDALDVLNFGGPFTTLPVVDATNPVTETNLITLAQLVVNPPASISLDSSDLNFGLVSISGAPAIRTVTIQNIGGQDLVIDAAINRADNLVAPFSFPAGGDNCSGQTLVSRATCTIDVEFAPVVIGDFQDSFDIPSNDTDQPGLVMAVRGTGASQSPVLEVRPAALDFGAVGTGQPASLTVTVLNLGGGQLQPLAPILSGTDSSAFSISNNACNGALLDIGQSCTVSVALSSFSVGSLTAALGVVADPGAQAVQVGLSANVTLFTPAIQLPASLAVPDVRFDASGVATLSVTNVGVDDLYVSVVDVQGADAALFSVTSTNCIDVAIAPLSSCNVQITFIPTGNGLFSSVVRVQSNDPDRPVADVPVTATASRDGDGVADAIEEASPNNGDGNLDGISDALQDNVTSLPDTNDRYVTLETDAGLILVDVQAIQNPSPTNTPTVSEGSLDFQQGFFSFAVDNVPPGSQATVTFNLPSGQSANNYFKFGRLPSEPSFVPEHWYEFLFDSVSQTGAEFSSGKIILNFVEGGRGDNDQTANGRIVDPGGPALLSVGGGSSGGGCSMLSQSNWIFRRSVISIDFVMLFAALMLLRFCCLGCVRSKRNDGM